MCSSVCFLLYRDGVLAICFCAGVRGPCHVNGNVSEALYTTCAPQCPLYLFFFFFFAHVVGSIVINLHGLVGALYTSEDDVHNCRSLHSHVSVPVVLNLRLIGKQALPLDVHLAVL